MVGQRRAPRHAWRCVDQRWPGALLRHSLPRSKRRQRSRPESCRLILLRCLNVRRSRAHRTTQVFRVVAQIKQPLETFHMPVHLRIETEGNPEPKTIHVVGTESEFTVETFARPKPGRLKIDPNNVTLKGSSTLRARAAIARGEELAEQGRYYDAIGQYQRAL